jgi:D-alanyl-D-alanine carboxypeptidase
MPATQPLENLTASLQGYVDKLAAVGVWVGIDIPGRPRAFAVAGRRSRDGDELITGKELYQIGSQTKTLVAIAILLLQRDGALSLDDKAADLIDLDLDPRITVRHLIMNTCGLGEYTAGVFAPMMDPKVLFTPRELYGFARSSGQLLEPGAAFDYCNTGWLVAGMILDRVAPGGYAAFVRRRIFSPLGLKDSYLWGEAVPMDRLARGYLRTPRSPEFVDTGELGLNWAFGAGDAMATHDDMLDLYRALLTPGNAIGLTLADLTVEVAKPSAKPLFALTLGAEYAYGLERRAWGGRPLWGHPGRTPGYSASTWVDPDNGIIVATAYTNAWDLTESAELFALRYNAPQLFTLAIMSAYALAQT